jgi:Ca2+-binding RTX toxin-like protein
VLADNGIATFTNGIRDKIITTDDLGGNDFVSLGGGNDQAIGGTGEDTIEASDGVNTILGDIGVVESDLDGIYVFAQTGDPTIGGDDTISGGTSHDVIFGGTGSDILFGGAGEDFIIGDAGTMSREDRVVDFVSIDLFTGGADTIDGGEDNDVLIGGFETDLIVGSLGEDTMVGEYARVVSILDDDYNIISTESVNTFGHHPLDLIARTEDALYRGITPVDEEFVQELISTITDTSVSSPNEFTSLFVDSDEGNPLSNYELLDGWRVINERYSNSQSDGDDSSGDNNSFPFEVMIDEETGDVIILNDGRDGESEGSGEEGVAEEFTNEGSQISEESEGSDDEGRQGETGSDSEENNQQSEGSSNEDEELNEPENTDEESNADDNQTSIEDTEMFEAVASGVVGWGVIGAQGAVKRTNNRVDLSEVDEQKNKRRFIRWDNLKF